MNLCFPRLVFIFLLVLASSLRALASADSSSVLLRRMFTTTGSATANEKALYLLYEDLENEKVRRSQTPQQDDAKVSPTTSVNISFQQWLDVFCEYALFLAREDNRGKCYDVLQAVQ